MMMLNCPHCRADVRIDDSRLPPGRMLQASCPSCKQAFPFQSAGEAATAPPAPAAVAQPWSPGPEGEAWLRRELESLRRHVKEEVVREILRDMPAGAGPAAERSPTGSTPIRAPAEALVVADEGPVAAAGRSMAADLGAVVTHAADLRAAALALTRQKPRFVIVDESVGGDAQAGRKVLASINALPGDRRRDMFVAFVATDAQTRDGGLAFACGVNLTVARADVDHLPALLRDGLSEHEDLYRVFRDVLREQRGG